jgi:hypothetical protein
MTVFTAEQLTKRDDISLVCAEIRLLTKNSKQGFALSNTYNELRLVNSRIRKRVRLKKNDEIF